MSLFNIGWLVDLQDLIKWAEPSEGFRETTPDGDPFPTLIARYTNSGKGTLLWSKTISYLNGVFPETEVTRVYVDGAVPAGNTLTEVTTYTGPFEATKTGTVT